MKLLIITQKVNLDDPILGFFHQWIEALARQCERVTVVCLEKGRAQLPSNVSVWSLGKEEKVSRLTYLVNFYRYIWSWRREYDAVLVHMNQEYVLLGGLVWKILGKPILLWRNHPVGNTLTRVAVGLSQRVYATSPHSFVSRFKRARLMPVGVTMREGAVLGQRQSRSILFLGRIAVIKNVELFVRALLLLQSRGVNFRASIVGSPTYPVEFTYLEECQKLSVPLVEKGLLSWQAGVILDQVQPLYHSHELYVNLTPDGSMDKTIFEAMAAGTMVLVSNSFFAGVLPSACVTDLGVVAIADNLENLLDLDTDTKQAYSREAQDYVKQNHSLGKLVQLVISDVTSLISCQSK